MKNFALIIAFVASLVLGASFAQAAPIITVTPGVTGGGNAYYVFNVNPNGTVMDTIDLKLTTSDGFIHTEMDPSVVLFTAAGTTDDTDVLGLNTVAAGWSILGSADDANEFAASGGPLGADIASSVDFAQAVMAPTGMGVYLFQFAAAGELVGTATDEFGIPEPGTMALAGIALIGLAAGRRRVKTANIG